MKSIDLTGQKFGSLVVMNESSVYISPKGYRKKMWHCICNCGNECDIMGSHLTSGHSQSCGCQKLNGLSPRIAEDLTGRKFGLLTVMYRMPNRMVKSYSRVVWHCKCDCGNETDVLSLLLTGGQTKSCGCLSISHAERIFSNYLSEHNVLFETEFHPKGLIGKNGGTLHYDFVIYNNNYVPILLIELDGEQHYKPVKYFGGKSKYDICVFNDNLKNEWAKEHNIKLLRIDVSKCTTDASFRKCYDAHLNLTYISN